MSPSPTRLDVVHLRLSYPILSGDQSRRSFVRADGHNLCFIYSGIVVLRTFRLIAALLYGLVRHVVLMCAEKQMRWLNAISHIAVMKNMQPIRNRSMDFFPHDAVCGTECSVLVAQLNISKIGGRHGADATPSWRFKITAPLKKLSVTLITRFLSWFHDTSNKGEKAGSQCWAGRVYPPFPGRTMIVRGA